MRPTAVTSSLLLHSAVLFAALSWTTARPSGPGQGEHAEPAPGLALVEFAEPADAAAPAEPLSLPEYSPPLIAEPSEVQTPLEPITAAISDVIAATPTGVPGSVPAVSAAPSKSHSRARGTAGLSAGTGSGGGASFQPPRYLACPPAPYPAEARARKIEGAGLLLVQVDGQGRPTGVSIRRSTGSPLLDSAAVRAAWAWRFEPARLGGRVIAAAVEVPVRFRYRG